MYKKSKVNKTNLREEILAGRKFGRFGSFCEKPPNLVVFKPPN